MTNPDVTMRKYLEEGGFGVEGELDPAGLLLLLRTETRGEGRGQEYRPQSRPWPLEPGSAEGTELETQNMSQYVRLKTLGLAYFF